jgi:phosphoglycolate phosphatase-like HAD superfamily hydrolase
MIKNILWDFDGVILNSMKIKGDGFIELFKNYEQKYITVLESYHYANGGISRFEKIKYFFNEILKQEISNDDVLNLADEFAKIITKNIFDKANLIDETIIFIENNLKIYNFHIVSGAENNELNNLCNYFQINKYFLSINGSPTKKDILIKNILNKYNYKVNETVLIGDSINDFQASEKNNIKFYGFNNLDLKKYGNYINTFKGFLFEPKTII